MRSFGADLLPSPNGERKNLRLSRKSIPISSRVRIEFYLPNRPALRRYEVVRDWLIGELTYLRGGTTRIEHAQGTYRSQKVELIADDITLLWCDFAFDWDAEKDPQEVFDYVRKLQVFIHQMLGEEEGILISLVPLHHFV